MTNLPNNRHFSDSSNSTVAADKSDDVVDLSALAAILWRGKFLIALVMGLFTLAAGYYSYVLATPTYTSASVVILETEGERVVDLQSVVGGLSGDAVAVNSEVEVLKSRSLMGKVVDRMNLIDDPEFNAALRDPSQIRKIKDYVKQQLGMVGRPSEISDSESDRQTRDRVITRLISAVSIRNVPNTLVLRIEVETENAKKSAEIADIIAELYLLDQLEVKFEATEQATNWLTERVSDLQAELEQRESELAEFSSSTDLVSADALEFQEVQLKDIRDRIVNSEENIRSLEQRYENLSTATSPEEIVTLSGDPQLRRLLPQVESDEEAAAAFEERVEFVLSRTQTDILRSRQQLEALIGSQADMSDQLASQSQDLIRLQQLTRETEATRALYEYFLTRLKETAAQHGIQEADSRILSQSVVPGAPATPRKSLILAVAISLGFLVGSSLVLLNEALKKGFRTARDLEAFTGYSVLGQIPQIPVRGRRHTLTYLNEKPSSEAAEAIRNLRTSVLLSNVDNPPKIIISTSAVPGEGKTTNILALANNLSGLGKKVLLIEGDIRRRTFNQYFDSSPSGGLVSVIAGHKTLNEVLHHDDAFGADVLLGEKTSTNAADLFASERFKQFLKTVRQEYDVVLIDTPPVLVVPDARIIAQQADAVLFTVRWDSTSQQQVEESLRIFHNSKQRITGLILSQINPKRMKAYGYGGKYGAYAGYGSKYYVN